VMTRLDSSYLYIVAGDGPDFERVSSVVGQCKLEDRVFMLRRVTDEKRNRLLHASDIFIMPNIEVDGDIEGFGIAAIEAGCCGLPVIASNLQGLRDAVVNGKTGFLVRSGDVGGFLERIRMTKFDREKVKCFVKNTFDWERVIEQYCHSLFLRTHM